MKKLIPLLLATSLSSIAADFDIEVQNLTGGITFTPFVIGAHSNEVSMFQVGQPASTSIQSMAEEGNIAQLVSDLDASGATIQENPARGLLSPGATTTAQFNTDNAVANTYLSLAAMLLPTNDGFVAANKLLIPTEPGVYTYYLNAYDAGTEANTELKADIPAFTSEGGSGNNAVTEGFIHIHPGNIGDFDESGGISDLDATQHRWQNPVAKLTIRIK